MLLRPRHPRIVNVHQRPLISNLAIDLRFTTVALHLRAIFLLRGGEVPIEFGPRGIAVDVYLDFAWYQLALREHPAHDVREEALHLVPAVRLAERVDKRDIWRVLPDLRGQFNVSCV